MENIQNIAECNDILSTDLTEVSIERPLITGDARVRVVSMNVQPNRNGDGDNLVIQVVTTEPVLARNGKTVPPGFSLRQTISLKPTESYPVESIQERLKAIRVALTGNPTGAFGPVSQYLGLEGTVRLRVEEAYNDVPERTGISFWRPAKVS